MAPYFGGCTSNTPAIDQNARQIMLMGPYTRELARDFDILMNVYGLVYAWVLYFFSNVGRDYDVIRAMRETYPEYARARSIGSRSDIEQSVLYLFGALDLAIRTLPASGNELRDAASEDFVSICCESGLAVGRAKAAYDDGYRKLFNRDDTFKAFIRGSITQYMDHAKSMFFGVRIVKK